MDKTKIVYVVAYRELAETESITEAWQEGNFEAYSYYDSKIEASDVAKELRKELKSQNRKDMSIFVHKARREWCERNLG